MHYPSFALTLAPSVLLAVSCAETPTGTADLSLEATISSPMILVGHTDTLTFRIHNLTPNPINLTFGSSCQVLPFIEDVGAIVVYPPSGSYGCFTVITTLTLPPFGDRVITQEVRGDTLRSATSEPILPPGRYRGYAVLQQSSQRLPLRSAGVPFEIR